MVGTKGEYKLTDKQTNRLNPMPTFTEDCSLKCGQKEHSPKSGTFLVKREIKKYVLTMAS